MCGICGMVAADRSRRFEAATLRAMREAMTHRGPDDAGEYFGAGAALGSRRLAILDLSPRGHMPMSTPDGRYHIVYNGEVYNFRELRAGLEARGRVFQSDTDTEVVLAMYAEHGPAMLDRLNGMFGIAIWDAAERRLFLARDRLGVKPVFYAEHDGALWFGSEAKALFAGGVPRGFAPECWEELLCFRFVAGERTPFAGVRRLLPGHYLEWREGESRVVRWWNLADRARALRETPLRDPVAWYRETFDSAVALRRISDVPVGVLLSGGLDSGSVAASLAAQFAEEAASFTVRFAEAGYDEGPLARLVAERWRLQYHELRVDPANLLPMLRRASRLNDEPLVHGNDLYLLAISEYARPRVTVLLSGEGGDETLGGYVRYRPLRFPRALRLARPVFPALASAFGLRGRAAKLGRFLRLGGLDRFVLFNACEALPDELTALGMRPAARFAHREAVLAEAAALYPNEPIRQAMYTFEDLLNLDPPALRTVLEGVSGGHHQISHHENDKKKLEEYAKINAWHTEQFAYMIGKMKAIKEGGGTLLDNSMLLWGAGFRDGNSHNPRNLPLILAGKGGGTIAQGRHVHFTKDSPLCNLYVSMLNRVGVPTKRFGDSTGRLSNLIAESCY